MHYAGENYELCEVIGRGGMGVVYRARDQHLRRVVAIKFLAEHLVEHPEIVERFQREAIAAASLNHPNIVTVYATGREERNVFLTMEFIEGGTLKTLLKNEGPQPVDRAMKIALHIAEALKAAHGQNIVHRDIKPENVMINKDGRIKVTDFGLARALNEASDLTGSDYPLGTPRYMSPEQCRTGRLDPRTDLYSLGVVLFELLTGSPPYRAENALAVMRMIMDDPFPRIDDFRSDLPPLVKDLLDRLVQKDPDKRFQSAAQVIEAIDEWFLSRNNMQLSEAGKVTPPQNQVCAQTLLIQYVQADSSWADWVARQLQEEGYRVERCNLDSTEGQTLAGALHEERRHSWAVCLQSPDYSNALKRHPHWTESLKTGQFEVLSIQVRPKGPNLLLGTAHFLDFTRLDSANCRRLLLDEIADFSRDSSNAAYARTPIYWSLTPTQFKSAVSNLPVPANALFTGRSKNLGRIQNTFASGEHIATLVRSEAGCHSVGMSSIAMEYAHLNQRNYSVIWWIDGSHRVVSLCQFAALAQAIELPQQCADSLDDAIQATRRWLNQNDRWLLIFDNVPQYERIKRLLPSNPKGHILITSKNPGWPRSLNPQTIGHLERWHSLEYLFKATHQRDEASAILIASRLSDNPLALYLAGSLITDTRISLNTYANRIAKAIANSTSDQFVAPRLAPIAFALQLNLAELRNRNSALVDLLQLLSCLSPLKFCPEQLEIFAEFAPRALGKLLKKRETVTEALRQLERLGLVTRSRRAFHMHETLQHLLPVLETQLQEQGTKRRTTILRRSTPAGRQTDNGSWAVTALTGIERLMDDKSSARRSWPDLEALLPHALAVSKTTQTNEKTGPTLALIWNHIAQHLFLRNELDMALAASDRATKFIPKISSNLDKAGLNVFDTRCQILTAQRKFAEAASTGEEVLNHPKVKGRETTEKALLLMRIGEAYLGLQNGARAQDLFNDALSILSRAKTTTLLERGQALLNLGRAYELTAVDSQALDTYKSALGLLEGLGDDSHPALGPVVKKVAQLLARHGHLAQAREYSEWALRIDKKNLGADHPEVARDCAELGSLLINMCASSDAKAMFEEALRIDNAYYPGPHCLIAADMLNLGHTLVVLGEKERAADRYRNAVDMYAALYGDNDPRTIHAREALANLHPNASQPNPAK